MGRRGAKGRLAAIAALAQADDSRAVAELTQAARDPDEEISRAALIALVDRGAAGPVADVALSGYDVNARAVATELLVDAPDAAGAVVARYLEAGRDLAPDADAAVTRILDTAAEDERGSAVAVAIDACADPDRQVRAAELLGTLRESSATPALVEMLHAPAAPARSAAAAALGRVQDPRAAPALVAATSDGDEAVGAAARQALAGMGRAASYAFAALPGVEAEGSQDLAGSVGALLESVPAAPPQARVEAAPAPVAPETEAPAPAPEAPAPAEDVPEPAPADTGPWAAGAAAASVPPPGAAEAPPDGVWALPADAVAPPIPVRPAASPPPASPPRRRRPVALALAGAAGLAVLVLALVLALGGGDDPAGERSSAQTAPTATSVPDGPSRAEVLAARRAAAERRRATEATRRRLVARSRAALRRRRAAAERRRRAAARRAAAAAPTAAPVATASPAAPVDTPAPVSTQAPAPQPTAPPPPPPPPPQPTPRPQSTPQVTQPDPVP